MVDKSISQFWEYLTENIKPFDVSKDNASCSVHQLGTAQGSHVTRKVGGVFDIDSILFAMSEKAEQLPVALSKREVSDLINQIKHPRQKLVANLLYGCGFHLMECINLRIRDMDFDKKKITVKNTTKYKRRTVPIPENLINPLQEHIKTVKDLHKSDLAEGFGYVYMPDHVKKAYPDANIDFCWQYLFPSNVMLKDPRTKTIQRHHLNEDNLKLHIKQAAEKPGITKNVNCQILRHSFAVHKLENGCDLTTLKELLGYTDISTTMTYVRVLETESDSPKTIRYA